MNDDLGESAEELQAEGDEADQSAEGDENDEPAEDLVVYEYVGIVVAGLGFFLTPVFTAPVAAYCVIKIKPRKPVTAMLLAALVLSTVVFWMIVLMFVLA